MVFNALLFSPPLRNHWKKRFWLMREQLNREWGNQTHLRMLRNKYNHGKSWFKFFFFFLISFIDPKRLIVSNEGNNNIGDKASKFISDALKKNSTLTNLQLGMQFAWDTYNIWLIRKSTQVGTSSRIQEHNAFLKHWNITPPWSRWDFVWIFFRFMKMTKIEI